MASDPTDIEDPWLFLLAEYLHGSHPTVLRTWAVLWECLKIPKGEQTVEHARRAEGLMLQLGWERAMHKGEAGTFQFWKKGSRPA